MAKKETKSGKKEDVGVGIIVICYTAAIAVVIAVLVSNEHSVVPNRDTNSVSPAAAHEIGVDPVAVVASKLKQVVEAHRPSKTPQRFIVGTNAAVDLIMPAIPLFDALGIDGPSVAEKLTHKELNDLQSLKETVAYHFSLGTAVERWYADKDGFDEIVNIAKDLPEELLTFRTGGNAALMATYLADHDKTVRLVAGVGPLLRNLLHPKIEVSETSQEDEIHMILEHTKGEKWGELESGRSNRFIFSHDKTNAKLEPLRQFADEVKDFDADVVIFSGVHMIEGTDPTTRSELLDLVAKEMKEIDASVPVHFELASIANTQFMTEVVTKILPTIDSMGLNEQELAMVTVGLQGPHVDYMAKDVTTPDHRIVSEVLTWLSQRFTGTRLTRIHFHSLTYHIIGAKKGRWEGSAAAVAAGGFSCSTAACESTKLDSELFDIPFMIMDGVELNEDNQMTWETDDWEFVLSPVLVCKQVKGTVGLGDAISATGIDYSKFIQPLSEN